MKSKKKTEKKQKKNFTYKISYRFPFYQRYMNVHKLLFISLCFFFFCHNKKCVPLSRNFSIFCVSIGLHEPFSRCEVRVKKNQTKQKEEKKNKKRKKEKIKEKKTQRRKKQKNPRDILSAD